MKAKKAYSIILILIMTASLLSGCGAGNTGTRDTGSPRTSVRNSTGRSRADEGEEDEEQPEDTTDSVVNRTDPSIEHYQISIEQTYDSVSRGEYGSAFFHTYDVVTSTEPYLPEGAERFLARIGEETATRVRDMHLTAEREAKTNEDMYVWTGEDCTLYRADSRVLSLSFRRDTDNAGSAYFADVRDKSFTTYNIDAETGAEIALTDVVKDIEALSVLTADLIYARYVDNCPNPAAGDLFESREQLAKDIQSILEGNRLYADSVYTWSPSYLGLRMMFFDEIASYDAMRAFEANGGYTVLSDCFEVTVPYTMAPEIFEASYTDLPEEYFARIETETDYLIDTGEGSLPLRVEVPLRQIAEYGVSYTLYTGEVKVLYGEEEITDDGGDIDPYMNFGTEVYLAKSQGKTFLYLCHEGEYRVRSLEVYEVEVDGLYHTGSTEEGFEPDDYPPLNPADFHTGIISFILDNPFAEGRVFCVRSNSVGEDGLPAPHFMAPDTPSDYRVTGEQPSFTLAVPLIAPYWDGMGVSIMESGTKTYPAGTVIRMTHTDNLHYVLFEVEESGEYLIAYAKPSPYGPWSTVDEIGGIPLANAFVLPYAAYSGPVYAAPETEEREGVWLNLENGDELWMYAYRGSFEMILGTTGDYNTGEVVYNGNPDQPAWQLVDDTGYLLADLYFLEEMGGSYQMVLTMHYASGDVTAVLYRQEM